MVEEMLVVRGIVVSHETIRQWGFKFGREFANRLRRRAPRRGDKWHLDEVGLTISGERYWLWRAVPSALGRVACRWTAVSRRPIRNGSG